MAGTLEHASAVCLDRWQTTGSGKHMPFRNTGWQTSLSPGNQNRHSWVGSHHLAIQKEGFLLFAFCCNQEQVNLQTMLFCTWMPIIQAKSLATWRQDQLPKNLTTTAPIPCHALSLPPLASLTHLSFGSQAWHGSCPTLALQPWLVLSIGKRGADFPHFHHLKQETVLNSKTTTASNPLY